LNRLVVALNIAQAETSFSCFRHTNPFAAHFQGSVIMKKHDNDFSAGTLPVLNFLAHANLVQETSGVVKAIQTPRYMASSSLLNLSVQLAPSRWM
jgi:hypothetical protein